MHKHSGIALETAGSLLEIQAVKLNVSQPFTWASGIKSPIYCDNRQILSFPEIRTEIAGKMSQLLKENYPGVEVIAGVATGAIAIGIMVASQLGLPFVYVRSSAKGHGLGNQVEGKIMPGKKTVVVEDLVSTGKSSLAAVDALREAGFDVEGMTAIFTYELAAAEEMMEKKNCRLITLSNYSSLIEVALENNLIDQQELEALKEWRKNPASWGENLK